MSSPAEVRRLSGYRLRLEGQQCSTCGEVQLPPRPLCRRCRSTTLEVRRFVPRGKVISFAEVSQAPSGFSGPYVIALVALEEGAIVGAQLSDVTVEEVEIGMPVEVTIRRLRQCSTEEAEGLVEYGAKFRLSSSSDGGART